LFLLGIGATIRVRIGEKKQICMVAGASGLGSTNTRFCHFGFELPDGVEPVKVEVTWIGSGLVEKFTLALNAKYDLLEGSGVEVEGLFYAFKRTLCAQYSKIPLISQKKILEF